MYETRLYCDGCPCYSNLLGRASREVRAAAQGAQNLAKADGWRPTRGKWLCPSCYKPPVRYRYVIRTERHKVVVVRASDVSALMEAKHLLNLRYTRNGAAPLAEWNLHITEKTVIPTNR